ncbi:MAG: diguanylate cyclase [Burkholderiales bacterium]|nr:diguanylate cyclase [Burkholderiales bacterium]
MMTYVSIPAFSATADIVTKQKETASLQLESGAPIMRQFLPQEYKAQGQNWSAIQNRRGLIYVGNNDGVLEYDGERWRLIPVANQTTARSLCIDEDDRIYVGAVGEIGYLEADAVGTTRYVSLTARLPVEDRKFSEVWRCFVTPKGVIFTTFQKIFRVNADKVKVWRTQSIFLLGHYVHHRFFVHELEHGLLELRDEQLQLVADGKRFASDKIYTMMPWHEDGNMPGQTPSSQILIGTRNQGFFIFDGKQYRPWKTEIEQELKMNLLYNGLQLNDGRLVFGTIQGGLYVLDIHGRLLAHLDRNSGLPDQAIYSTRVDQSGGLWLTLDRGIVRIEIDNPLTQFHENNGLIGAVLSAHRFHNTMYAATTQGIFQMQAGPRASFQRILGTDGPSWQFLNWRDRILIANYQGVYQLKTSQSQSTPHSTSPQLDKLLSIDSAFSLAISRRHPDLLLVGARHGIFIMRFRNDVWENLGSVAGVNEEIRTLLEDEQGRWWLGTNTAGTLRLSFPNMAEHPLQATIERFGVAQGLPSAIKFWGYQLRNGIRFGSSDGVYRFNETVQKFEPDPAYSHLFPTPRPVYSLHQDQGGGIWMISHDKAKGKEELGKMIAQADGDYHWSYQAFRAIAGERAEGMQRILSDADGVSWFGGTKGLFRYDPRVNKNYHASYATMIRQVSVANETIYGGGHEIKTPIFEYQDKRIRFDYAAPSFDGIDANQYQVFLEGSDRSWSDWSRENYRDYSNLYEGHYRFRVRAKNIYDNLSEEANYSFTINAPWYRMLWAYVVYALLLVGIAKAMINWRTERLNAQKKLLENQIQERTKELEIAYAEIKKISVTDHLTGLGNRRFLSQALDHYRATENTEERRISRRQKMVFMLIDIDHFKMVNDSHGHAAGDAILVGFADILRLHCRRDDVAVRWGGEEFLMCAQVHDEQEALHYATRLRLAVDRANFAIGLEQSLKITCSIGLACWPFDVADPENLEYDDIIHLADAALYLAKRSGRDQCIGVVASPPLPVECKLLVHSDVQNFLNSQCVQLIHDRTST